MQIRESRETCVLSMWALGSCMYVKREMYVLYINKDRDVCIVYKERDVGRYMV